jgi:fructokinase
MSDKYPRFVSAGEALTDMIRIKPDLWASKNGGSTWNVARAVAALGIPSAFAGAISRDGFGDALWSASREVGLNLRFIQRVERSPLLAIVEESHPPRYYFVGENAADLHFDASLLPAGWQRHVQWAHFGSISLARPPLAGRLLELADTLHGQGVPVSFDPNVRNLMDDAYLPTFERMCRLADVVKLSDEDLGSLLKTDKPAQAFAKIRAWNPAAWWLYTEGARGATLFTPDGEWRAAPPAVTVVDTVGAGDAAMAGLIASRLDSPGRDGGEHLAFAVAAGTAACQHAGANPPTREALAKLLPRIDVHCLHR